MTGRPELDQRLGDVERRAVVEALGAHRDAGRLTPEEVEDRQYAVVSARTWSDVVPLFADLPAPYPAGMPEPARNAVAERARGGLRLTETQETAAVTVISLGATALFFITDSWLPFLAIPAVVAILDWNDDDDEPKPSKKGRSARSE